MKSNTKLFKTSSKTAEDIHRELDCRNTGVIGTVGGTHTPQLTAVYYMIDDDFVVSFATKRDTRKHQNIQKNNHVQLLVFDEMRQLTIQVSGEAHEVADPKIKNRIIENVYRASYKHNYQSPPISKLYAGDYVGYQILPKHISMAFFLRPQSGGYDMFQSLNFEES